MYSGGEYDDAEEVGKEDVYPPPMEWSKEKGDYVSSAAQQALDQAEMAEAGQEQLGTQGWEAMKKAVAAPATGDRIGEWEGEVADRTLKKDEPN